MKKIIILAAGLLVAGAGDSAAVVKLGDTLLWFNGGYSLGTLAGDGSETDGAIISFGYEKLDWDTPVSFGFGVGYSELSEERTEDGVGGSTRTVNTTVATVPFQVGAKYWLGQGGIQAFLGASLGIYFSEVRRVVAETGTDFTSVSYGGAGMGVPLGIAVGLGETITLNGNYTLNWMWSNEAFENDLLHTFNLGVGFNLGG